MMVTKFTYLYSRKNPIDFAYLINEVIKMNILKIDDLGLQFELDGNTIHITGNKNKELTFINKNSAMIWFAHFLTIIDAIDEFTV